MDLASLYESGLSFRKIAQKTGLGLTTVVRRVKAAGVQSRPVRTHGLNETFFGDIDSPIKAYWLGFIMADAYVKHTRSGTKLIRFNVSWRDHRHLRSFLKAIGSSSEVKAGVKTKSGKTYKLARACVFSSIMYKDLERLGAVDFKTGSTRIFGELRPELIRHVCRGLFDGDGSVFLHKASRQIGVGYCDMHRGNVEEFMSQMA